jgi:hypothetical protein
MSYILGGLVLMVGIVLWAVGETWFEMRRYRQEAAEEGRPLRWW